MREKTVKEILKSTPDIYNKIAPDFYQTRQKPWPVLAWLKSYVIKASNVVDLGCGSGRLSELVEDSQNYLGLDNSNQLIKIAKNNYSNRKNLNFQVQDILDYQLPENNFDLTLLIAVLHHLPTIGLRLRILKNIHRSLKNNGQLIITSWNLWQRDYRRHLFNYKLKLAKYKLWSFDDAFIPWKTKNSKELRYVHSFSRKELKKLLETAGFKVREIFYEYQGQPTSRLKGKNLIVIAEKI